MKCKFAKTNPIAAMLRRVAVFGGLALTAVLGALPHAGAQSPVVSSPGVPTPYSWPNFHAGGPEVPQVSSGNTALSGRYYALPDTYNFSNPLSWQLNGTPTGIVNNTATEIPSFLIGNFNPLLGPSGAVSTFFPNHFRDGSFYQIAGPFPFIFPNLNTSPEVVDDTDPNGTNIAPNTFAILTGAWGTVNNTDTTGTYTTATNLEYRTTGLAAQDADPTATAQWTISTGAFNAVVPGATTPSPLPTGFYSIMVHLPNSPDAATNSAATTPLIFSQDAHYIVQLNPTQFTNPNAAGFNKVADVRIQQGIVNDQTLAGPFLLQPSDKLYVTLDNSTNLVQSGNAVVVADSISLQQNTGGDVESAPAAINVSEYPEIANAEYYGLAAGTDSTLPPVSTPPAADTLPRGNVTINQTPFDQTRNKSSDAAGANHAIRQLVYFGRLETIVQTRTVNGVTTAVRDPNTGAVLTQQVGAVYCMDGFTGGIAWRYQTPGTYNLLGQVTSGAGPVFSSPAIARINVLANPGSPAPYATKLVVVIADNRGFVYCLDAVGNRDGTSNSNAVYQSTDNTLPNYIDPTSGLTGLPILNPGIDPTGKPIYTANTGIGDFGNSTADPPHEGNTRAYWVYRPDSLRPKVVSGSTAGAIKTTSDPASDLPTPGSFGLASPTVYTAGYVAAATGTTGATDYPGATGVTTLNSNSIVYIGNSNGVLYALDGLGYPVTLPKLGAAYVDSGTTGDPFNATLDIENKLATATLTTPFLPTPKPLWWFSIRGAVNDSANTSTATIESAPAVFVNPVGATGQTNQTGNVTVYVTSAHESSSVSSSGRLYAIDGLLGPSGNGGRSIPTAGALAPGVIPTASVLVAGTFDYNVDQRPQLSKTDTQHWSFPDAYGIGKSSNGKARPPLGNITGSPVAFANSKESVTVGGKTYPTINIYIAANSGPEVAFDETSTTATATVPDDNTSGRIWKVNLDGSAQWAYPLANDPNDATLQNKPEPSPPMGAFLHAAPAMGYVQFPATIVEGNGTAYTHSDQSNADVKGQTVPMLYVATSGYDDALAGPGFYALDIDTDLPNGGGTYPVPGNPGDADSVREIEAIASPSGESFVSSPALVVNPSLPAAGTAPGNGGAVFVVGSSGTLVQFGATPITNNFADGTNQPYFPVDKQITGLGPISAPAVGASNVLDLVTQATTSTFFTANNVQDWVYLGSSDGLCFGITPAGFNGGGFDPGTVGPPSGPGTGPTLGSVSNQFILHTYIEDDANKAKKDFTASDVPDPNTSTTKPFEWGENVYVRITNVVPPLGPKGEIYKAYDTQGTSGDYYANGQAVTFSISSSSPTGGVGRAVPAQTIQPTLVNGIAGTLPGNGFVIGTDTTIPDGTNGTVNGKLTTSATDGGVATTTGTNVWVAATTFPVRDEEPGAQHRLISATQVASHYDKNGVFLGSVTLQATLGQGTQFENPNKPGTLAVIPAVTQPVFGILNPLAVRGAGIPIAFTPTTPRTAEPIGGFASVATDGVGPFRGLVTDASGNRTLTNTFDLQALTNGNRVYTQKAPPASVSGTINENGGGRRRNRLRGYPQRNVRVTTSTGLVNHNSTGSNADPNAAAAVTLFGNVSQSTNNGLTPPAATPYGQYMLDIADRSALGLAGLTIANLRIERSTLGWNDNNGLFGNNAANGPTNGAGAAINPLPWDDTPVTGSNHSRDYPDIKATALSDILNNTDVTAEGGTPSPAQVNANVDGRNIVANPVKVQVTVPRYQPANLQFWDQGTQTPITPDTVTPTNDTFPMGYVNTVRVYVDTNKNGRWDAGEAYRNVQLYSGVPVDMSTTIDTATTDLGKLPQGFGLATDDMNAPALGTFMPYPTLTQINGNGTYLGNRQNPGYVSFFKPLTISNRGNTNLLNVHLDQKVDYAGTTTALPLLGDTLEQAAKLPAYDINSALTGPRGNLPAVTNISALPFLVRSSLDDDLVAAFGHNPGLAGTAFQNVGATFHKSRVGDSNPSILTVPDVPRDNDPTNAGNGYNLAPANGPPVATATGLVNGAGQKATSVPYVAFAIPQGTPVGTYATRLQLFEGVDPRGYKNIYNGGATNGPYVPILPPRYGTQELNLALNQSPTFAPYPGAVSTDLYGDLVDTLIAPNNVPSQPYSNGTVIKATVTEARITDGASRGNLPQVDNGPTGYVGTSTTPTIPTANFLPSAFRDPSSGNVSLYWTSSRGITPPYSLIGANLSFKNGYFAPLNAASTTWWNPISLATLPSGVNSALSVASGDGGAYAFVQNVSGSGGAPMRSQLLCYQVTPSTGALTGSAVPVTVNASQATFGARGLVFDVNNFLGATKGFPDAYPGGAGVITNNVWAFWQGGARGRSAIYYSGAKSADVNGYSTGASPFAATAVLPIPAGLVSVSDASPVQTYAADSSGNAVPVIEVTYTGIAADGNADIYVSRYRPYIVRDAQGNPLPDPNDKTRNLVALALVPPPFTTEQLQATDGNLWWQARDVAWANPYYTPKNGGGFTVANLIDVSVNGTGLNLGNVQPKYDKATNTLVYTNITLPTAAGGTTPGTVYVDLARGRIRFNPQYAATANLPVFATFSPQSRRITTDSRADTAPISFIDKASKENEAGFANTAPGTPIPQVETDRYWFIWRKSGASGTSTTPTLYYKTQRLTVDLQLRDANGQPIGIKLDTTGKPLINVTLNGGGSLYSQASGGVADVDWVRGRVYFPIANGVIALEGQTVTITGTDKNGNAIGGANGKIVDQIHWLDEPRFNEITNPAIAAGSTSGNTAFSAAATGDAAIPIDTVANESNVTAFLDPFASATNPHKVWLFWNSTRNGTADLYYETISPLFSATVGR